MRFLFSLLVGRCAVLPFEANFLFTVSALIWVEMFGVRLGPLKFVFSNAQLAIDNGWLAMTFGCGHKKEDADPRKSLGAAVHRYERFRQVEVQRFDALYSTKAADHSAGRNQAIAHLLSCLSLMRSVGDINKPQPILDWSKAQVGAVSGTVDSPAAHCLPCQLWIDNKLPWDLVRSALVDGKKLVKALKEDIFGLETILPLAFNLADSRAENNCLRGALVAACEYVIANTLPRKREAGVLKRSGDGTILLFVSDRPQTLTMGIDHQAVKDGYGVWRKRAAMSFAAAKEDAREGVVHCGQDYTEDVKYILTKYEESLAVQPPRASDDWMWDFENDLWI